MATPTTNFYDPGPTNVFIPAATSLLQVEFSRNPLSFGLATYMQIIPGQAVTGLFPELSSSDPVTVVNEHDTYWPDGQERPRGRKRPLRWVQWRCKRHSHGFQLGSLTVDQAAFDIVASHARASAAWCMTNRTLQAQTVLTTSGNWPSANQSATVDALLGTTGEDWVDSSTTENSIKRSFNKVKQVILQQTGGVVSGEQLCVIINPVTADKMSRTAEILDYMKAHEQAMAVLRGVERRFVDTWGLPPALYGIEVCVEDAVRQTTRRKIDGTGTLAFIFPDDKAVFASRVGGLIGPGAVIGPDGVANAAPSFTTLTGFFNEEMTIETEVDGWNRITKGDAVDNRDIVLTAPNSGYLIEDTST